MPRSAMVERAYSPMPSAMMRARGARSTRDTSAVRRSARRSAVRRTAYAISATPGAPGSITFVRPAGRPSA